MAAVSKNVRLVEFKRSLVPARWEDTVRVIGMSECKEAALSLSHSFAADDLSQYLLDADDMLDVSAEDKWKLHVDIMTYFVAATCLNGIVTTIGPDYEGVALWYVVCCRRCRPCYLLLSSSSSYVSLCSHSHTHTHSLSRALFTVLLSPST